MLRHKSVFLLSMAMTIALISVPLPGMADVIYTNDGKVVFGIVESENESHIFFRQRLGAGGHYQQRVFQRSEVKRLLVTVDQQRLEQLTHGDWETYRDWAEELAMQSPDPEARDMAIRLFLIVARYAGEPLRAAAFRGAIRVAGNNVHFESDQHRRIQTLAFQEYDGQPPWQMDLAESAETFVHFSSSIKDRLREVAAEVRQYRQGKPNNLAMLFGEDLTRLSIETLPTVFSSGVEIPSVPDFALRARLMKLELAILSLLDGVPPEPMKRDSPWSVLVNQARTPVDLVSFGNVTSFDLEATVYRDGSWKKPQ